MSVEFIVRDKLVDAAIPPLSACLVVATSPTRSVLSLALQQHHDPTMRNAQDKLENFTSTIAPGLVHDAWMGLATKVDIPGAICDIIPAFHFYITSSFNNRSRIEALPATRAALTLYVLAHRDSKERLDVAPLLAGADHARKEYGWEGTHVFVDHENRTMLEGLQQKMCADKKMRADLAEAIHDFLNTNFALTQGEI